MSKRVQNAVWDWQGTVGVVLLVLAPLGTVLLLVPATRNVSAAASVSGLVVYPVVMVTAVMVYFQWRITGGRVSGWVALALTMAAVNGVAFAGMVLSDRETRAHLPGACVAVELALATLILLAAHLGEKRDVPGDPVVTGLVLGLTLALLRFVLSWGRLPFDRATDAVVIAISVVAALVVEALTVVVILRLTTIAGWVRLGLAASLTMLSLSQFPVYLWHGTLADAFTVLTALAGSMVLCGTAAAMLRSSIHDDQQVLASLNDQLAHVEDEAQVSRAQLHEVTSTLAGITSASRLIRDETHLSTKRREVLEEMMDAELIRLGRLLQGRDSAPTGIVDLDHAIGRLVVSHHARGNQVHWEPNGARVSGRPDDVTEVLNILLDNAAKHGGGSATVEVTDFGEMIEIAVSDDGPGVAPALRSRLFEWAVKGPGSSGQGIGLNIAHRLMSEQGGYLRHEDTAPGTTFVVGLRAAVEDDRVAQSA